MMRSRDTSGCTGGGVRDTAAGPSSRGIATFPSVPAGGCSDAGMLAGEAGVAATCFRAAAPAALGVPIAACCLVDRFTAAAAASTFSLAAFSFSSLCMASSIASPEPRSSRAAAAAIAVSRSPAPSTALYSPSGLPSPRSERSRCSSSHVCIVAPMVDCLFTSKVLPLIASIVVDLPTPPCPRNCS